MCSSLLRLAAEKIVGWFAVTISHLSVFPSFVTMQNQNFFFFQTGVRMKSSKGHVWLLFLASFGFGKLKLLELRVFLYFLMFETAGFFE